MNIGQRNLETTETAQNVKPRWKCLGQWRLNRDAEQRLCHRLINAASFPASGKGRLCHECANQRPVYKARGFNAGGSAVVDDGLAFAF